MILLILIYSNLTMVPMYFATEEACLKGAELKIGSKMEVRAWDNMGGSNPIPVVFIALCSKGYIAK